MIWRQDHVALAAADRRIVAGFNVFGYEDAQAVIRAAERLRSPVLLMVNRDARQTMNVEHWAALLRSLAEEATVPVGVHLDHCREPEAISRAIGSGFTSVMYDGSREPLTKNIEITQKLARQAHERGVFLEAELGTVPYNDLGETEIRMTNPTEARQMQMQTQADWLAVSVGNIHRLTTDKVPVCFPVLQEIQQNCSLPLVIHGASGIRTEDLHQLRTERVGKMNFGTVLRQAFGNALRVEMERRPEEFDRLKLFAEPTARVEEAAYRVMSMLWAGTDE